MPTWTLADAQAHLDAWLAADLAVASGQAYTIGSRSLTRANSAEIAKQIAYWSAEVTRLEAGRGRGLRVLRAVPRDV